MCIGRLETFVSRIFVMLWIACFVLCAFFVAEQVLSDSYAVRVLSGALFLAAVLTATLVLRAVRRNGISNLEKLLAACVWGGLLYCLATMLACMPTS